MTWDGLGLGLGNLSRLSDARSRSISAENRDGSKGGGARGTSGAGAHAARGLGLGWKVAPCEKLGAGATLELADIAGSGAIQHVWMTLSAPWRFLILRVYWDDQAQPSIEVPAGDFFCCGWGKYAQVNALPVNVNPGSAFNCWWEMPFRKRCRVTLENLGAEEVTVFWQIDYCLTDVPEDRAYLHAQFRRTNPVKRGGPFVLLDGVRGQGHYVGTYMCWGVYESGWWGEGELKFFLDGDGEHPTICGTGTEDYFGGSYNFEVEHAYREFSAPFVGLPQVLRPDELYQSQQRFGLYRFHVMDPLRFERDLRVTVQCLGWRLTSDKYLLRQDDLASTAFWYQSLPTAPFPALPGRDELEVV